MPFVDKTLVCVDCGEEFIFSAGEQEFYKSRGLLNEPKRCPSCRARRREERRGWRETFKAVCASCGKECEVPFRPRGDRPVYCSECFARMKKET